MLRVQGTISGNIAGQKPNWYFVQLEQDFSFYYRKLSRINWNIPLNGTHITFIAGEKEGKIFPSEIENIKDTIVTINYDPTIETDGKSFWFRCWSYDLDTIRNRFNLGLKKFGYHITLGNFK